MDRDDKYLGVQVQQAVQHEGVRTFTAILIIRLQVPITVDTFIAPQSLDKPPTLTLTGGTVTAQRKTITRPQHAGAITVARCQPTSKSLWCTVIWATNKLGDRRLGDKPTGRQPTGRHVLVNWATWVRSTGRRKCEHCTAVTNQIPVAPGQPQEYGLFTQSLTVG